MFVHQQKLNATSTRHSASSYQQFQLNRVGRLKNQFEGRT